jgi:hypothetical protein
LPPNAYDLVPLGGAEPRRTLCTQSSLGQDVSSTGKEETAVTLKMKERSGNVVENKGPASEAAEQSGNVIENKGSYASKAGMLLKRKVVSVW